MFETNIFVVVLLSYLLCFSTSLIFKRCIGPFRHSHAVRSTALNEPQLSPSQLAESFLAKSSSIIIQPNDGYSEARLKGVRILQKERTQLAKEEAWRHTNLKTLFMQPYERNPEKSSVSYQNILQFIHEDCLESCLVFIDGVFNDTLSRTGSISTTVIGTSANGLSGDIKERISSHLKDISDESELPRNSFASDTITAVNLANFVDIAAVHVQSGVVVEQPLQVLFYSSRSENGLGHATASYPRLIVLADAGSSIHIRQTYAGPSSEKPFAATDEACFLVGANTQVILEEGASVIHTYVQELPGSARHLEVLSASLAPSTSYHVNVLQMGARVSRVNAHIDLNGSGINATLHGVNLAHSKQSLDVHSSISHLGAASNSRQQQRNIIGDGGEAIFKGRIRIPVVAQKTDSDQLCRSLLLGRRARIIAMPTLEITADDVTCSHGASVTDLDQDSLFYLSARGVSPTEARKLLLRGFALELMEVSNLGTACTDRIIRKLESMNPEAEKAATGQQRMSM